MVAQIGSDKYHVSFAYGQYCWDEHVTRCLVTKEVEKTFCNPSGRETVAEGVASCHPNDNFNKVAGRKLALARALREAGLNKEERTEIWEQYKATHKYVVA